ncbi:hypothetical protein JCM8097_005211 [Rhodosporidiobolus ruineniae]
MPPLAEPVDFRFAFETETAAAKNALESGSSSSSVAPSTTSTYQAPSSSAAPAFTSSSAAQYQQQASTYNGGSYCGKTSSIAVNGKTIQAKVADKCAASSSSSSRTAS